MRLFCLLAFSTTLLASCISNSNLQQHNNKLWRAVSHKKHCSVFTDGTNTILLYKDGSYELQTKQFKETGQWLMIDPLHELQLFNRHNAFLEKQFNTNETPIAHLQMATDLRCCATASHYW